jgi:hypothetical protein
MARLVCAGRVSTTRWACRESRSPSGLGRHATEYGNTRRGHAACALTDVLHAQFNLALARFKAGKLDYDEVEDVLRKVPEDRKQNFRAGRSRSSLTPSARLPEWQAMQTGQIVG